MSLSRHARPPLSREELSAVVVRAQAGDRAAVDLLVATNIPYLLGVANAVARRHSELDADDLVSEGTIGLLYALRKFDPARGVKFNTYANYWVQQAVHFAASRARMMLAGNPRGMAYVAGGGLARALERAQREGVTEEEAYAGVQRRLGLSRSVLDNMAAVQRRPCSLDSVGHRGDGELGASLGDTLASSEPPADFTLGRAVLRARILKKLRRARKVLSERESLILTRRLLAEPDEVWTLKQLGDLFGVSREYVRQVEVDLRRFLKAKLGAEWAALRELDSEAA